MWVSTVASWKVYLVANFAFLILFTEFSNHAILGMSYNVAESFRIKNKLQFAVENFKQYKILYFQLESHLAFTKQTLWKSLSGLCTNFDVTEANKI
jgi:hypothetical protein